MEALALLAALAPLLQSLGVPALTGALSSITITQWLGIAFSAAKAAPDIIKVVKELHPALGKFLTDIIENGADHGSAAAELFGGLQQFAAANGDEAIKLQPGMGSDY